MSTLERRLARLETRSPAAGTGDAPVAGAVFGAWLKTVADDDLELFARVRSVQERGGDLDQNLSVEDKLAMARLRASYDQFVAEDSPR